MTVWYPILHYLGWYSYVQQQGGRTLQIFATKLIKASER
jgi:hypothetical protein